MQVNNPVAISWNKNSKKVGARMPRADSGSCGFFVRIRPIRFMAGCRKRRLNQG